MNGESPVMTPKTILILAANPNGSVLRRFDQEVRDIAAALQRSQHRDRFVLKSRFAVTPRDVQRAMLEEKPQIVHFCGQGEGETGLVLEDESGEPQRVSTEALAELFRLFAAQVKCVLLNACYSEVQARSIAQHIDAVIGMSQPIGERAAIEFATSFYDALGAGEAIAFAFALGRNMMQLQGVAEDQAPVLIAGLNQKRSRLFISYKRGVEPDEPVAREIFQALQQDHEVFIDQTMPVGTLWAERIEAEIRRSDFLITVLSAESVHSEMVRGEIELAHQLCQTQSKPRILPIRLGYRKPFAYPLSEYLNGINWAFWESAADTDRLIAELRQAIAGQPLSIGTEDSKRELTDAADPVAAGFPFPAAQVLEPPEGTMDAESDFYVVRSEDERAIAAIRGKGATITIKAPRQMGKSSLLIRIVDAAMKAEKQVVFLDFQLLDQMTLADADAFFRQFCHEVTNQLELENRVEEYWQRQVSQVQRCTDYLQYVLKQLQSPLLLAMDEVDRMFDTTFGSDFFSMLRSWHNKRALPMTRVWKNLDLALVTATEPYHLIANLNQSPFNVGEVMTLADFTAEQVAELNRKHGDRFSARQAQQLMDLLSGHPYLVRKALYAVASGQLTVEELFAQAIDDRGVFGDHLRYHLFRITDRQDLLEGLRQVIRQQRCSDQRVLRLLSAAGLVYRDEQAVRSRCRLYAAYFGERLDG
jgi:AAA-like domain/TIR domain/CHAT domain